MWLKKLVDLFYLKHLSARFGLGLILAISPSLFQACASSHVESQKSPSASLWMYHTYAWRAQGSTAEQAENANKAKDRTDLDLAKQGLIPVPYNGNPDAWILQEMTPYNVTVEFRDAHTGKTYWKGEARFSPPNGAPTENAINSAIDKLVNHYVADQDWMSNSWWLSSGIQKG